jgi:hypothetical protein
MYKDARLTTINNSVCVHKLLLDQGWANLLNRGSTSKPVPGLDIRSLFVNVYNTRTGIAATTILLLLLLL